MESTRQVPPTSLVRPGGILRITGGFKDLCKPCTFYMEFFLWSNIICTRPDEGGCCTVHDAGGLQRDEEPRHGHTCHLPAVQYSTVQYSTVQYSTVQYSTVQYRRPPPPDRRRTWTQLHSRYTVQYSTVQYTVKCAA